MISTIQLFICKKKSGNIAIFIVGRALWARDHLTDEEVERKSAETLCI